MQNRKITTLLAVSSLLVSVTGCGMAEGYQNWAYRVGSKMPTYSDKRCPDDKWFCWEDEDYKISRREQPDLIRRNPTAQRQKSGPSVVPTSPDIPNVAQFYSRHPAMQRNQMSNSRASIGGMPSGGMMPPTMAMAGPNGMPPMPTMPADYMRNLQAMQRQAGNQAPAGIATPDGMVLKPLPPSPAISMAPMARAPQGMPMPSMAPVSVTVQPVVATHPSATNSSVAQEEQMKPWEENPEWKKDLPRMTPELEALVQQGW